LHSTANTESTVSWIPRNWFSIDASYTQAPSGYVLGRDHFTLRATQSGRTGAARFTTDQFALCEQHPQPASLRRVQPSAKRVDVFRRIQPGPQDVEAVPKRRPPKVFVSQVPIVSGGISARDSAADVESANLPLRYLPPSYFGPDQKKSAGMRAISIYGYHDDFSVTFRNYCGHTAIYSLLFGLSLTA